jgi:hypothetical protein
MTTRCGLLLAVPGNSLKGHEDRFLPPRLNGRCRFSQTTFAGTHGNERDAPIAVIPRYRSLNGSMTSHTWLHVLRSPPNTPEDPAYSGNLFVRSKREAQSDGYTSGR